MNTYAVWSGALRDASSLGTIDLRITSSVLEWRVYFPASQDYDFELSADNYAVLYVDDVPMVNTSNGDELAWRTVWTARKHVTQGWHKVKTSATNSSGPAGVAGRIKYLKSILLSSTSVKQNYASVITELWTTLSEINPLSEPKYYTPLLDWAYAGYSGGLLNPSYNLAISSSIKAYSSYPWANPFPGPAPTTRGWTGTNFNTVPAGTSGYYVLGKINGTLFTPSKYCVVIDGTIVYGPSSSPPPDTIAKAQQYSGVYTYASQVMADGSEWDFVYAYDFYTPTINTSGVDTFTWNVYFPVSGNYYVQLTLDDYGTMKVDDTTIMNLPSGRIENWNVINGKQIYVKAGYHTITIQDTNLGGPGGVAGRIYRGPTASGEIIWTTRDNYNVNSLEVANNDNFEWKPINEINIKQNGQWVRIPYLYVKRGSVWIKVYGNETPTYIALSGLMNNTSGDMYPPFGVPPRAYYDYYDPGGGGFDSGTFGQDSGTDGAGSSSGDGGGSGAGDAGGSSGGSDGGGGDGGGGGE
jgi:hypothetical protein